MEPEGMTKFWPRNVRMNKPTTKHRADAGYRLKRSFLHLFQLGSIGRQFFVGGVFVLVILSLFVDCAAWRSRATGTM